MAKKKTDMTKHKYETYNKRDRYDPSLGGEGEDGKHTKRVYGNTFRKLGK